MIDVWIYRVYRVGVNAHSMWVVRQRGYVLAGWSVKQVY